MNKRKQCSGGGEEGRGAWDHTTVTGRCLFGTRVNDRKDCPLLKALIKNTAHIPYTAISLQDTDVKGWGVLPWRRGVDGRSIALLLSREFCPPSQYIQGGYMLNILGGQRLLKGTDSLTCDVDKLKVETGAQIRRAAMKGLLDTSPIFCWNVSSKYALFLYEQIGTDDRDVDARCAGFVGDEDVKSLEWVTRQDLMSEQWVRENMHDFASTTLERFGLSIDHLEALFDMTHTAPSTSDDSSQTGISVEERHSHFDIVAALHVSAGIAEPYRVPVVSTNVSSSYANLRSIVSLIPRSGVLKLKRRFHPDFLLRSLHHPPSDDEKNMAKIASQALNGLFMETSGGKSNETDVMANIEELNRLRCKALPASVA